MRVRPCLNAALCTITWLLAISALPAAAQPLPGPTRPLPQPSQRPLPAGDITYVDTTRGDDAADGSRDKPLRSLARAVERVKPGQTVCLRGGIYYERVTLRARGTPQQPITIRSFPGELAILDGGIPDFVTNPAAAWEPAPGGAPGEFRSTREHKDLSNGVGGDADGDGQCHVFGNFADTMVPLQGYRFHGDLQSDNPWWNVTQKVGGESHVYCGPGIWYDVKTSRIHCRLAHTKLPGHGDDNYRGPTDPRTVRMVIAGRREVPPLTLDGAENVRLQDLVIRGAAGQTVMIDRCRNIEFDGLTVYGGAGCINAKQTNNLRLAHTALRGIAAPWTFRGSLKYRSVESRLFSAGRWDPTGDDGTDLEFAYCEFTDSVDGVFIGNVRRTRIHHCLLDNITDDGIFLTANSGYDGVTHGGDVHVYQSVLSRCLTTFAFGVGHGRQRVTAAGRQSGAPVFIYRNVFDFRRPLNYYWPSGPDAPQELSSRGRFAGDHGGPLWEPMRIYHNTVLSGDAPRYDYLTDGWGHGLAPGTTRRVFNNVVVQAIGATGGTLPPTTADFVADGNQYWTADAEAQAKGDPLTKFRKSPAVADSKRLYPPGWCANDIWADPKLTAYSPDWRQPVDARLAAGSPATDSGVVVPAEWPDPLRAADVDKPDRGAVPAGAETWRVGVRGRLTAFGQPVPAAVATTIPEVKWDLAPSAPAARPAAPPGVARAAIFTGYPAFDAPILAYLLRRQGSSVELFDKTFPDIKAFENYDLVAIDGSMIRAKLQKTRFADDELPKLRAFLERGGTLLLMRERADVLAGDAGQALLKELTGGERKAGKIEKAPPKIANAKYPWVAHLPAAEQTAEWLARINPTPLTAARGETSITAGDGRAVLLRVPVGKGQLIYVGWSPAATMPNGREKSTVAMEEAFLAQVEVLRRALGNPQGK